VGDVVGAQNMKQQVALHSFRTSLRTNSSG
jgi:hypothetical protein